MAGTYEVDWDPQTNRLPKAVVAMQVKRLASSAQTGILMVGTLAEAEKYLTS